MIAGREERKLDSCGERNKYVFALFLGFIFYHYLEVGYRVSWLGQIRGELLLGILLLFVAILSGYASERHQERVGAVKWSIWLISIMALMVLFSVDIKFSWGVFVDRVIKFALLGLFIAFFVRSPRALKWFLAVFLLAFLKMGQEGLAGLVTGTMVWENQEIMRLHGSTPRYAHPNSFSGTQVATLPFVLMLLPLVRGWLRIILLVQLCLVLIIVLYTGSRTGYVALIVLVLSMTMLSKHKVRTFFKVMALFLVLAPLVPGQYWERAQTIFGEEQPTKDTSRNLRIEILKDATSVFLSNPFGVGVGAFPIARELRFGRTQDTHNLYLEVATNLGIQGFIVFMGFICSMLYGLMRLKRLAEFKLESLNASLRDLRGAEAETVACKVDACRWVRAVTIACFQFIVIRLALGLFGMDMYEVYWWFAIGLFVALTRIFYCIDKANLHRQTPHRTV